MTTIEELECLHKGWCHNSPDRELVLRAAREIEALQRQVAALTVEYSKQPEWIKRILEQQSEIDSLRSRNRELRECLEQIHSAACITNSENPINKAWLLKTSSDAINTARKALAAKELKP